MNVVQTIESIVINPNIRGGRPCIAETGLRVTDVVIAHLFHRRTPDETPSDYAVSLAHVYAALASYYEHKLELDEDIRQQIVQAKQAKEQLLGGTAPLLS